MPYGFLTGNPKIDGFVCPPRWLNFWKGKSMVYLYDQATGVTVEDEREWIYTHNAESGKLWTTAEADALLRGLLALNGRLAQNFP
jgi:hypothetical protein